ncbi:hypothetical protein ACX1GI_08725 [Yersinia pseudotuberculosis]|uniref:hypothetical protein n=1 Tax=Yersinia pseudotuberculosis TaxID=633 RepID=UPI0003A810BB|nr:hypothetical protein [Yersinia pseudotuberculosis]
MKQAYFTLINDLLQQYHFKAENLRAASAVADEVRMFSLNDYAFRLGSMPISCCLTTSLRQILTTNIYVPPTILRA